MKFRLEATPAELWQKGTALVEELVKAFSGLNPDLAERLEKALPPKEQELKYPVLQGLRAITTKEYEATVKRMLGEIGKVLDQSLRGPTGGELQKAFGEQEEKDPGAEEEEKPEPGDVDPETGDLIPEEDEEEEEGEAEEGEEKSLEKAELPQSEPLQHDFTAKIAEKDARAYARVKRVLTGRGYTEADFEQGGVLYGYSVNQLIDLVRGVRKGS